MLPPASALSGCDTAHIVERTCDPGVIACPPAGPGRSFQLAAGPWRFGGERMVCTYLSLFNGDGADLCFDTASVKPLTAIEQERAARLGAPGIARESI